MMIRLKFTFFILFFFAFNLFSKDIFRLDDVPGSKFKKAIIEGTIEASPEQVWSVLTDYEHYADFMPRIKTTKILSRSTSLVHYEAFLNMPWPISDVSYACKSHLEKPNEFIRFAMVPGTGKGVKTFQGSWKLRSPIGKPNLTLIDYMLFFEPEKNYPSWAVDIGIKSSLGKTLDAVRSRCAQLSSKF